MLRCFTAEHPVRGIAEMSDETGLGRSTTCRYAVTLVALGYLEQNASRKYRLSARGANVGLCLLNSMTVRDAAREHLRHLRNRVGHTVSLGLLAGSEVFYLDQLRGARRGQYAIDVVLGPGTRQPVYCTAAGKALLALLPAAEQREVIVNLTLRQVAPSTFTSTKALRADLARIAAAGGVAVEDEELLAGRRALATTVFDGDRRPVAAVEVAVPATAYIVGELVERVGPVVSEMAGQISTALGH